MPGCGSGHDVLYLRRLGFDVTGLDISENALLTARSLLQSSDSSSPLDPSWGSVRLVTEDFFAYEDGKFDFIFDYLFFSALDPPMRADVSRSIDAYMHTYMLL